MVVRVLQARANPLGAILIIYWVRNQGGLSFLVD